MWENEFDVSDFETGTPVKVFVKQSEYVEIQPREDYFAYISDSGGFRVCIEKFPMGLYFAECEIFHYRSRGTLKEHR